MRKIICSIYLIFSFLWLSAQKDSVFQLKNLPVTSEYTYIDPGLSVDSGWKYKKGDDLRWAAPGLDDGDWEYQSTELNLRTIPLSTFEHIGWFRIHLHVDTALAGKTLALMLTQNGASEVYLNGKLIHVFGKIDVKDPAKEERFDPQEVPVDIRFERAGENVLAVRYANTRAVRDFEKKLSSSAGFTLKIGMLRDSIFFKYVSSNVVTGIFSFYFTFFIALSFLHLMFFLFYRANRSNLYYSIFAGSFGTVFLAVLIQRNGTSPDFVITAANAFGYLGNIYIPALLAMLYSIFHKKLPGIFWLWFSLFALDVIFDLLGIEIPYWNWLLIAIFAVESLRIILMAILQKREGAWIIGVGIVTTIVSFMIFFALAAAGSISFSANGWAGLLVGLLVLYATISIPVSMTIFLARDFAKTSHSLSKKLIEVEELSARTIEQEKEKQKILETRKEMLEQQVKERTAEIVEQKQVIEEKNKDITDSINYAKTIQEAILPAKEIKYRIFPDSFVLFKPKDIVSGDFYWFAEKEGKRLIAACDCTGHGVPGALMSMIGNNVLHQIIIERNITAPSLILDELNKGIIRALKQDEQTERKDGMDVALLVFDDALQLQFSGAQRPLWMIRDQELHEIKGDKFPIGGIKNENGRAYTNHSIALKKGDVLYIFSDGYADQFSASDKKLMTKRFKEILLEIHSRPMPEQERYLDDFIESWKGKFEQTDDILVIGIRI